MTRTSTVIMAITSRIWINPPMVYDVTIPRSQSTMRTTQIVHNISSPFVTMTGGSVSCCRLCSTDLP